MRYYIPDNILSIAHRGYSSKYKDNSWPAFKNVKKKGFDMIEIDIQLCKSGEIIIYHDTFLKNKQISTLTLTEIKKKNKSIITLKEFFEYFDSNIQPVYLDMKGSEALAHRLFCFLNMYFFVCWIRCVSLSGFGAESDDGHHHEYGQHGSFGRTGAHIQKRHGHRTEMDGRRYRQGSENGGKL